MCGRDFVSDLMAWKMSIFCDAKAQSAVTYEYFRQRRAMVTADCAFASAMHDSAL